MVKLYCPKCQDVYTPKSSRHHHTDGAYFGTGFPHMLFMVHPEYRPKRPANQFVPRYMCHTTILLPTKGVVFNYTPAGWNPGGGYTGFDSSLDGWMSVYLITFFDTPPSVFKLERWNLGKMCTLGIQKNARSRILISSPRSPHFGGK